MAKFSVVFDPRVLYPAPLRDTLMRMALADLYKAHWTDQSHDTWISELPPNGQHSSEKIEQIRTLIDANVRDCIVTGYEHVIEGLDLPNPNNRHILAAAIRCNADAIITKNIDDFPEAALAPYDIEALHPDDFIFYQIDMAPVKCCDIFKKQRQALKSPPLNVDSFLTSLLKQELPQSVSKLKEYMSFL